MKKTLLKRPPQILNKKTPRTNPNVYSFKSVGIWIFFIFLRLNRAPPKDNIHVIVCAKPLNEMPEYERYTNDVHYMYVLGLYDNKDSDSLVTT